MGGCVAFAIRKNGVIHSREMGKAAVDAISTVDFFHGKGEMMSHWNQTIDVGFAPIDYGLVAVDFDNKWVGAIQGYNSLDSDWDYKTKNKDFAAKLHGLVKAGRLRGFQTRNNTIELLAGDFDEWLSRLRAFQKEEGVEWAHLSIAPPKGWNFQEFDQTGPGWAQFLGELIHRGWELSPADMDAWDVYLSQKGLSAAPIAAMLADMVHQELDGQTPRASSVQLRRF